MVVSGTPGSMPFARMAATKSAAGSGSARANSWKKGADTYGRTPGRLQSARCR